MRALVLALALATLALPMASAQEYVAAEHVFAFAFVDAQPVVGTQQTLLIEIFDNTTGIPVGGLADALTLALVLGDATKTFALTESDEVVGQYSTRFLPTQPGNYTARLTGKVNGTDIEVVAVLPGIVGSEALAFPPPQTIEARLDDLESRVEDAKKGVPAGGVFVALAALGLVALSRRLPGGGR